MLSFIIVFASIPALRVKANDSIIDKTRKGSITIHKYLMKEMPVDGKEATGEVLADTDIPSGAIPLGGVTFDIYKVADLSEFVNQDTSIEVSSLAKSEQEIIRLWRKTPSDVKNALKCILKKLNI